MQTVAAAKQHLVSLQVLAPSSQRNEAICFVLEVGVVDAVEKTVSRVFEDANAGLWNLWNGSYRGSDAGQVLKIMEGLDRGKA